jgi:hypothetical protein
VLAHLRKGETYADLAAGFAIGTTTVFRYIREALDVLTAMAPALHEAVTAAAGKAFVIVDGTLLRIDRSAWPPAAARASGPMPSARSILPMLSAGDHRCLTLPSPSSATPSLRQRSRTRRS